MATEKNHNGAVVIDRLALSRAQHLKSRDNRPKSVSDDENDAISDWSDSDLECSPLSDFESTSNVDGTTDGNYYGIPFDVDDDPIVEKLPTVPELLRNVSRLTETPLPMIIGSRTSTRMSFTNETEKSNQQQQTQEQISNVISRKPPIQPRKQPQTPLLPGRRIQSRQVSPSRSVMNSHVLPQSTNPSCNNKTVTPSPTRLYVRRVTTSTNTSSNPLSTKESPLSSHSSLHTNNENHNHQRHIAASPNFSQTSTTPGLASRIYEIKKLYVDDYDYGRLSNVSAIKSTPSRSRQKWGTIVHPPFPLGYQQIAPEQLTQAVERLASPVRCRDRHKPSQTSSKRYLSVEETEALVMKTNHVFFLLFLFIFQISRLTNVKPIRSPDQYWPTHNQSRPVKTLSNALKTNNNWKGVGISA